MERCAEEKEDEDQEDMEEGAPEKELPCKRVWFSPRADTRSFVQNYLEDRKTPPLQLCEAFVLKLDSAGQKADTELSPKYL